VARADQGPFDLAAQLLGMEDLLMAVALGEEPEKVHALLDFCRRVVERYAHALIAAGGRSTSIGEPFAGPDVLSPRHYREYALPHEKKLSADLSASGVILANHICGNVVPIIEDFVSCGAPILEIDHKTDMAAARRATRGRVCLLGPIDTILLATGTPAQVEEVCREALDALGPDGLILGPGCAMGPETPAENVHSLVQSVRKHEGDS
jgi:MtaA/CmuA family methyltransferase